MYGYRILKKSSMTGELLGDMNEIEGTAKYELDCVNKGIADVRSQIEFDPDLEGTVFYVETFKIENGRPIDETRKLVRAA